ncbi:P-loop containing nucleoside triphosphate hydrolase protein [Pelagophyceae sp. CCMP2097]|nr:P-loop containing nucleoside triphosphate hydrolase protein [Pelagophyceae sp. CCMP2097]
MDSHSSPRNVGEVKKKKKGGGDAQPQGQGKKKKGKGPPQVQKKKMNPIAKIERGEYSKGVDDYVAMLAENDGHRVSSDQKQYTLNAGIGTLVKKGELDLACTALDCFEMDPAWACGLLNMLSQSVLLLDPINGPVQFRALVDRIELGLKANVNQDQVAAAYFVDQIRFTIEEFIADAIHQITAFEQGRGKSVSGKIAKPLNAKSVDLFIQQGYQQQEQQGRGITQGDSVILRLLGGQGVLGEFIVGRDSPLLIKCSSAGTASHIRSKCEGHTVEVIKLANRTSYSRTLRSIGALATSMDTRSGPAAPHRTIRDFIVAPPESNMSAFEENALEIDRLERFNPPRSLLENATRGLDKSQAEAVKAALCERLTLIQGPPGTGKTKVAVQTLAGWVTMKPMKRRLLDGAAEDVMKMFRSSKILATSDSNVAVDNLLEGLANLDATKRGQIKIVRLGQPESIRPELMEYCVDAQDFDGDKLAAYENKIAKIRDADIVCATCIGSGTELLDRFRFDCVLIDECAQATEPTCLVPIVRGARQVVLVGDQCQLPPTVLSTDSDAEVVPLFTRLINEGKLSPKLLATQYRMHPMLAQFANEAVYAGRLANGVTAQQRVFRDARALRACSNVVGIDLNVTPFAFAHIKGGERKDGVSQSNEAEAQFIAAIVQSLTSSGVDPSEIAVISPYAAQVRLIRRALGQGPGRQQPGGLEVSSVDAIQGREKEIIIMSTVRSNESGQVGFVKDWRRLNVSLTRARRVCIVVGDATTLIKEPTIWGPFVAWAVENGVATAATLKAVPRNLRFDVEALRARALQRTPSLAAVPLAASALKAGARPAPLQRRVSADDDDYFDNDVGQHDDDKYFESDGGGWDADDELYDEPRKASSRK